jgi:hypothetical protein
MRSRSLFLILLILAGAPAVFAIDGPTLFEPADNNDVWDTGPGQNLRFRWGSVSGAAGYRLCITSNTELSCSTTSPYVKVYELTGTEKTISLTDFSRDFLGRNLKWGVQSIPSSGSPGPSAIRNLWLRHRPASLGSPAHNTTVQSFRPAFTWTAVSGVAGYKVVISTATDPWGSREAYDINSGSTTSFTPSTDIPSVGMTGVYWSVIVCQPINSCGFNGKVQDQTARWINYSIPDPRVSFATHIYPMITSSCSACHGGSYNYPQKATGRADNRSTQCNEAQTIPFDTTISASEMYNRFRCLPALSTEGVYANALNKVYVMPNQPKISGLYWKAQASTAGIFSENRTINNVTHQVKDWIRIWIEQGASP